MTSTPWRRSRGDPLVQFTHYRNVGLTRKRYGLQKYRFPITDSSPSYRRLKQCCLHVREEKRGSEREIEKEEFFQSLLPSQSTALSHFLPLSLSDFFVSIERCMCTTGPRVWGLLCPNKWLTSYSLSLCLGWLLFSRQFSLNILSTNASASSACLSSLSFTWRLINHWLDWHRYREAGRPEWAYCTVQFAGRGKFKMGSARLCEGYFLLEA